MQIIEFSVWQDFVYTWETAKNSAWKKCHVSLLVWGLTSQTCCGTISLQEESLSSPYSGEKFWRVHPFSSLYFSHPIGSAKSKVMLHPPFCTGSPIKERRWWSCLYILWCKNSIIQFLHHSFSLHKTSFLVSWLSSWSSESLPLQYLWILWSVESRTGCSSAKSDKTITFLWDLFNFSGIFFLRLAFILFMLEI